MSVFIFEQETQLQFMCYQ